MSDCVLRAAVVWKPRNDIGQFVASRITPAAVEGVTAWTNLVLQRAQQLVPVRTGELRDSGHVDVVVDGKKAVGRVVFDAAHAGYVEYGTGIRGSSSAGAGPYAYSSTWPGMPAQAFLRPASDEMKQEGAELLRQTVALVLR